MTLAGLKRHQIALGAATLGLGAVLLTGCSGTSSTNHAEIRAVNAIAQAGQLSMIVNSGAVNGTQPYGSASGYLYLPQDGAATASFVLGNYTTTYPAATSGVVSFDITGDDAYTLVAYGDPGSGIASTSIEAPNIKVLIDNPSSIPSGSALVRIVNTAPDAGTILYALGSNAVAGLAYGAASAGDANGYITVPAGATALQVTSATTGATLFSQSLKLASGQAYTVLVSEPTIAVTTTTTTSGTTATTTTGATTYAPIILSDK